MLFVMSFGAWLKEHRKAAGMSQVQLADRITSIGVPVTNSYVSMIEREYDKNKKGFPTRIAKDIVEACAKVLGVDVNEALIVADYAPTQSHIINGYKVDLPYGIDFVIPHGEVSSQDEANEFAESVRLAVEIVKERLARISK